MPDIALQGIEIDDELGAIAEVKPDLTHPCTLVKFAKTEFLRFTVAPDLRKRAAEPLAEAAAQPISLTASAQHEFGLGSFALTPQLTCRIRGNSKPGADLFDDERFPLAAAVPAGTGYAGVELGAQAELAASESPGGFSFGFDSTSAATLAYWRAFSLADNSLTFGRALAETFSHFTLPVTLDDLARLAPGDICMVSGQGSLTISGGFSVSAAANPLASLDLPLDAGTLAVKTGAMAGLSASLTLKGSYQIRVESLSAGALRLSVLQERGTVLRTDLSASAGVSVEAAGMQILDTLLAAIGKDPSGAETTRTLSNGGLAADEAATLTGAIRDGLNRSLAMSVDLALSRVRDNETVFQYRIDPAQLDEPGARAVERALRGDLSGLTQLETTASGTRLASGVEMLSSVLTQVRSHPVTFRLNLLGLVNFTSLTDVVTKSVVIRDPDTGYLTIADSVTATRINALTDPQRRHEALHKAVFESLILTAAYRVSGSLDLTGLAGHMFHFAFNGNLSAYLRWFHALELAGASEGAGGLADPDHSTGSTCLLRTEFDDTACHALFLDPQERPWPRERYLEFGRQALLSCLDRAGSDVDRYRFLLLSEHATEAFERGPTDSLAELVGLRLTIPSERMMVPSLIGDVATIAWWSSSMASAANALAEVRKSAALANAAAAREHLRSSVAHAVSKTQARFDQPWGLLALFLAASGSASASGRITTRTGIFEKPELAGAAGKAG